MKANFLLIFTAKKVPNFPQLHDALPNIAVILVPNWMKIVVPMLLYVHAVAL